MIRHTLVEGLLLLRQRAAVSLTLAVAIAVPIGLAGVTLALSLWLGPLAEVNQNERVLAVLLHPDLDAEARSDWLEATSDAHPDWRLVEVPQNQLVERLVHWFPYMRDVLDEEGAQMLPPLIEIGNPGDDAQQVLGGSPEVVAIGPGSSVERMLSQAIARVGWLLALLAAALLAAAALLTAVWVHLELFRHADEITIMRLIGATEAAIRGPFLLAVALPGLVAALLSAWGTVVLARLLSALSTGLSLPPVTVPSSILFLQAAIALSLPIVGALITLARHARLEIET